MWATKSAAAELIGALSLAASRRANWTTWPVTPAIGDWARWCRSPRYTVPTGGPGPRRWPTRARQGDRAEARAGQRIAFHEWLQWLTAEQLAAARQTARRAGMSIGVITDLAVGAHPGGADAWAWQGVIVPGSA